MPSPPFLCFSPRPVSRRGSSLVIILAFVVLLTVLVVAYFSYSALQRQISQASVNQAAVEIFAQGAVNTIIGDLKQEILASSTNISTNPALYSVYYPNSAATMIPATSGFTAAAGLENLIKVSRSGTGFFPANANYNTAAYPPANRAVPLPTTTASQNGRTFSTERWNAPLLLAKSNSNSATDLTPVPAFSAPDWILVARSGSNPTSWNNNLRWSATSSTTVVGRYAYAIYDEGGLLDMNAAGFPPGSSAALIAEKGSLAAADLSVIPGMSTNAISAVVGWRNYVTSEVSGSFPGYAFTAAGQAKYFERARTNTGGFLRTSSTTLSGGQSDRMFVSRQQLIQFLTQGVAANDTERAALQTALRYLGTFSRDLEQPSFRPDPSRPKNTGARLKTDVNPAAGDGGNDSYDPSGQLQDVINPAVLTARNTSGQLVIKRRFPLSRLAMVSANPQTEKQADIKKYFGLQWDSSNARWNYTSPDGNTAVFQIKTLTQISGLGREPDFFETLKATIECGSLGKQHGGNEVQGARSRYGNRDPAVDGYIDLQILQIGANLIDQFDADSRPTTIHTSDGPVTTLNGPKEPPAQNTSGVENLPYLYGWMSAWYRTRQLDIAVDVAMDWRPPTGTKCLPNTPDFTGKKFFETATLIQPILWNPHAPDAASNPPDVPTEFRVVAGSTTTAGALVPVNNFPTIRSTGTTPGSWWTGFDASQSSNPPEFPFNGFTSPRPYIQAVIDPGSDWISFNTTPTGKAAFREPYRLQSPNYPPGSNATSYPEGTITPIDSQELNDPAQTDTISTTAIGFYTGRCWTGPTTAGNTTISYLNMGAIRNGLRIELQYRNPYGSSPEFITYDTVDHAYCGSSLSSPGNLGIVDNDDATSANRGMKTGVRADPRSNRWGLPTFRVSPAWDTRGTLSTAPNVFPQDANPSFASLPIYKWPQGTTLAPDGTSSSGLFYRQTGDNQGGVPKNSGWRYLGGGTLPQGFSDLAANLIAPPGGGSALSTSIAGGKSYYTDPDGVLRRASAAYFSAGNKDGLPLTSGNYDSRPVILNRPFRSVAEMGYAFRGVAWKDLDFFTPESGDAALLDAFCLNELESTANDVPVAGRIHLNTRQPKVLEAVISGVSKAEGGLLSSTEAQKAAAALTAWTADTTSVSAGVLSKGPLRNRSELVGKFVTTSNTALSGLNRADNPNIDGKLAYSGFSSMLTTGTAGVFSASTDAAVKRRRESILRALVDSGNTRTWNLLIDIVGQVGRYPLHASAPGQFVVEGETRFWVHLAIDRATGKIIAQEIETVSE